jgi:TolB-like protein
MEYSDIKATIQDIATNLTSIVSISIHDYTHQPRSEEISNTIDEIIVELKRLRRKIDVIEENNWDECDATESDIY